MSQRNKIGAMLVLMVFAAAQIAVAENAGLTLPFSVTVTEGKIEPLPDYMSPKNPNIMDFPYNPLMIDGEFWVMYKNGYSIAGDGAPVFRFKGTNIENALRQPDGACGAAFPVRAPYILGGMWYDPNEKKIYAPMHCEVAAYAGYVMREIHLTSSIDKGLTWKYEGALLTSPNSGSTRTAPTEFSGLSWDGGDGDHVLFVDERCGFFYLFTNHYTWPKAGSNAMAFLRHHVARCAIRDKMAPGKWQKFYNGAWSQPGVGGKASFVNGYCVTYNRYLKKYLSLNYNGSLSQCSDLEKQDWSPSYPLGRYWGYGNPEDPAQYYGTWPTDISKTNIYTSDQTFLVYAFWIRSPGRRWQLELGPGQITSAQGLMSPSLYLINTIKPHWAVTMDPSHGYSYRPLFESLDPVERRRTYCVPAVNPKNAYTGTWTEEPNLAYYDGRVTVSTHPGDSVQFTFSGADIYWRGVRGPDCGKADVYLDEKLQATVDCWASLPTATQFGFIKTGLDPHAPHTITIKVRGDKNDISTGTAIKHLLFEYSADTYRSSDCFSSIQGKNQWRYQQNQGDTFTDLAFQDPNWQSPDGCVITYFHMTPGTASSAVRKWTAPHKGKVRIEGNLSLSEKGQQVNATILHNTQEIWSAHPVASNKPVSHEVMVDVNQEDALYFIVNKPDATSAARTFWDPVVTYINGPSLSSPKPGKIEK